MIRQTVKAVHTLVIEAISFYSFCAFPIYTSPRYLSVTAHLFADMSGYLSAIAASTI